MTGSKDFFTQQHSERKPQDLKENGRILSFDYLRILACFGVVMLHASARLWYYLPTDSADWFFCNCLNITTRISVPLFVMISGALFLDPARSISLKDLWSKSILRLFLLYLLWMTLYALAAYLSTPAEEQSVKFLVKSILTGRYHLWFLPMLIGLYALIPLLRTWLGAASKKEEEYFLLLFFLFQIGLTSLKCFLKTQELLSFLDGFQWTMLCNYLGYFILGHYLTHQYDNPKLTRLLFIGLPFFYLGNVLVSTFLTYRSGEGESIFYDSFGILTALGTCAVFLFFIRRGQHGTGHAPHPIWETIITEISKSTLGIYLMHLFLMETPFPTYVLNSFPTVPAILFVTVYTFVLSLILSTVLRKIPVVGKYIC